MEASPVRLLSLLREQNTIYKIPVYQRKYEWNKEHVKQYFSDIERIISYEFTRKHFLGTIVYLQSELPDLMTEKLVIDGQQRITTTFILLKAIKDIVKEHNIDDINSEEIENIYLLNPYKKGEMKYKLRPVDVDREPYQCLMRNEKTESRIYENYEICKELIYESRYDISDIYKALGYLDIVYISLDERDNPQIIFESLNSTGLSLTQSDLIRNFILMGLSYDEQTELYNNYWRKIEEFLPNKIISEFVRDYLTMKEGITPKQNKVYESFKNYFYKNNYNSEDILKELVRYSKYYYMIINGKTDSKEINSYLNDINNIRNTVSYPFLLKLLNDYYNEAIDNSDLIKSLKLINSYIYRRNICNVPTNALNRIFAVLSKEVDDRISKGFTYVDSIVDYLMSRSGTGIFPRDEEFKRAFINNDLYNKSNNLSRIILHKIEKEIHKEVVDIEQLTVEHIMPQTLNSEWNIELGKNSHEIHRLYRNTIGNLTLTNYNSEMGNKSFQEKKSFYKDSNIKITRNIKEYIKWTESEIIERGENLFKVIKKVWFLPEDNYKSVTEDRLIPGEEYSIKDNVIVTGYSPKVLIIDNEKYNIRTWKEMLVTTCKYLNDLDEELFISLPKKPRFQNLLSKDKSKFRRSEKITRDLYVGLNLSAKDILSYVYLFFREYGLEDLVYFEIR